MFSSKRAPTSHDEQNARPGCGNNTQDEEGQNGSENKYEHEKKRQEKKGAYREHDEREASRSCVHLLRVFVCFQSSDSSESLPETLSSSDDEAASSLSALALLAALARALAFAALL